MGGAETGCRSAEGEEESLNPDLPPCHSARIRVSVMTERDIPVWAQVPGGHTQRLHRDRGFLAHLVLFPLERGWAVTSGAPARLIFTVGLWKYRASEQLVCVILCVSPETLEPWSWTRRDGVY